MNFIKIFAFSFCSLCFSAENPSQQDPTAVPPATEVVDTAPSALQPTGILVPHQTRTLSPQDIIFLQGTVVALTMVGSIASILSTGYGSDVFLATAAVIGYQLMNTLNLRIFSRPLVRDASLVAGTIATGMASLYSDVAVYPFVVLLTLAAQRGYEWSGSEFFADRTDGFYNELVDCKNRLMGRKKDKQL